MVAPIDRERPRSFALGSIVATPGALSALKRAGQSPMEFLNRHASGDWGEVDEEDRRLNDRALVEGTRLLSAYRTARGEKLWIITEWDRSATNVELNISRVMWSCFEC